MNKDPKICCHAFLPIIILRLPSSKKLENMNGREAAVYYLNPFPNFKKSDVLQNKALGPDIWSF